MSVARLIPARRFVLATSLVSLAASPQLLTAQAQSGDGIFVGPFTAGTVLRDNLTRGNGGDGIEAQGSDARVGGNQAFSNGDFGIDAAAGVTDLGGNQASGNGNPLQCRNVFCS